VHHYIDNHDGWTLSLFQTLPRARRHARPVLIVPGYGMNSFIFSFHPRGLSLEAFLADAGFEVWRADLRAQGESSSERPDKYNFRLDDLAVTDLSATIDYICAQTGSDRVDVMGASLGGTLMFAHAVLVRDHKMGAMVAIGSPLRWVEINPFLRLAALAPELIGKVRIRRTRALAQLLLPPLAKLAPKALSLYLNPKLTDISRAAEMLRTVEDPNPWINRQLAYWIRKRDLILRGHNICTELAQVTNPLLTVLATYDGIVPRATALFPHEHIGSTDKTVLEIGSSELRLAHADLFISDPAQVRVFAPIAEWLGSRS
jgi:pimeloyl-ACP methyl ester carboxylesterase